MRYLSLTLIVLFLSLSTSLSAKTLKEKDVPLPLKPWVDWVLFDEQKRDCPFIYNNFKAKKCAWPARMDLNISKKQARFSQSWQVFESSWIILPGDKKHWPQNVSVNNNLVLVTEKNNFPSVFLKKGTYKIKGNIYWESIPENIQIPADSALVNLYIKGINISNPVINQQGQVWLADNTKEKQIIETDKTSINVFRLLDDQIPMRIVTRLELQISGAAREVNLGKVLLDDQIPLSINSRLPTLLTSNGELRIQVKPGSWTTTITSRATKNIVQLGLSKQKSRHWPSNEVWAFKAQNHLRVVKLDGATRIDPRQTKAPKNWKNFPTFRLDTKSLLKLNQTRRGDEQPQADKLNLKRQMWLDFNGDGYTIKDEIKGTITKSWRLETLPELDLGRVTVDGIPQFITKLGDTDQNNGIEIRRGAIKLSADSRYNGDVMHLSATGWKHEFKSVSTTVHLPPGWRVFSASGIDNVPQTWLQKWTLLDLFIVLIIAISIARLWSWPWGIFGLVTMSLIWHESGFVPQFIWLNILAVIAIVKLIPDGKFKNVCTWYRNGSVIVLLLITIPFMVTQVRTAIYPQLEKSWFQVVGNNNFEQGFSPREKSESDSLAMSNLAETEAVEENKSLRSSIPKYSAKRILSYQDKAKSRSDNVQAFDPKANIQTGPGLPKWTWNKVYLNWNGPVQEGQQISLVLISPFMHTLLNFLRVIFVVILCLLMVRSIPNIPIRWVPGVSKLLLLFALVPILVLNSHESLAKDIDTPSQKILSELKTRLTQPPECLPNCAQIQTMVMRVNESNMQLKLNVHALQKVAIPLPARDKQWLPSRVTIDGRSARAMYRASDGVLWLELPKGRFNIVMSGSLKLKKFIQLPMQLKPRIVQFKLSGWSIEGIQENGVPDAQLQLSREQKTVSSKDNKFQTDKAEVLPPFLIVERHLKLGLDWFIETTVRRISPIGSAVVVNVPLLLGESIITENIRSKDGKVLINMSARQRQVSWRSRIEINNKLNLKASADSFSTEIWAVSISPVWHLEYDGIPVIKHKSQHGRWSPRWHPWHGEEVNLIITRPQGIKGNTLTIDQSRLLVKPSKRAHESELNLSLRSSQGGQYSLALPENSNLQSVSINNAAQSIRLEGRDLTIPVTPGKQNVKIVWRNTEPMSNLFKTPQVDLKVASVNHSIKVKFTQDRWVLLVGGPDLGPAILFWGVLLVILLVAVALGFTSFTPLNTLSWILLGIGLSQVPIWMGFIVVAWLFMLGLREKLIKQASDIQFNMIQVAIGAFTFLSLICLFSVIQHGLLGSPDMQVAGNGSSAYNFNWYQDRNVALLQQAWLLSVPTLVYRLLMLGWALWLAFSLLRWLKWGWQQFSTGGMWKDISAYTPASKSKSNKALPVSGENVPAIEDKKEKD